MLDINIELRNMRIILFKSLKFVIFQNKIIITDMNRFAFLNIAAIVEGKQNRLKLEIN